MKKDDLGYIKEKRKVHNGVIVAALVFALMIVGTCSAVKMMDKAGSDQVGIKTATEGSQNG